MDIVNVLNKYINNILHICLIYNITESETQNIYNRVFKEYFYCGKRFKNERYKQSWLLIKTCKLCEKNSGKQLRKTSQIIKDIEIMQDKYKLIMYMYYYLDYDPAEISILLKKKINIIEGELNFIRENYNFDKSHIKKCFNDFNLGIEEKEHLLDNIMNEINKKRVIFFYRNKRKINAIVTTLLCCLIIIGIRNIVVKEIEYKQNSFSNKQNKIIKESMVQDGQKLIIDDYTITLERLLYDKNAKSGTLLFSVVKKDFDMNKEYVWYPEEFPGFRFGEDGRFEFFFVFNDSSGLLENINIEKHKDLMYIYYEFSIETDGIFDDKIYLFDNKSGKANIREAEIASGEFDFLHIK